MPLYNKGRSTIKYPLYFSDLVSGIMAALDDPASKGMIFDARGMYFLFRFVYIYSLADFSACFIYFCFSILKFSGPEALVLAELMDWMHDIMDKTNMKEGIFTRSDLGGYGYRRAELWTCPGTIMNTILMQHVIPIGQKYFRGNTLERLERVCIFFHFELL